MMCQYSALARSEPYEEASLLKQLKITIDVGDANISLQHQKEAAEYH